MKDSRSFVASRLRMTAPGSGRRLQVLLDERRTQMYVELDERLVTDHGESVDLARFDDENVAGAGLEFLAVHDVPSAPRLDELNLVVRMPVRTGTAAGLTVEQKYRHADVALIRADEMVRSAPKRQIFPTHLVHSAAS